MGQLVFCERCKAEGRQVALGSITDKESVVVMTWQKEPLPPEFRKINIYLRDGVISCSHCNLPGIFAENGRIYTKTWREFGG